MELGDQVNALTSALLLDEDESDSNLATNLAGGAVGSVPAQSGPNATAFVASPTTSGHTFLLGWQPSGSAVAPHAIDATSLTLAVASSTNPIVDGTATPGVAATFARGDHVHPTDTSRQPALAKAAYIAAGAIAPLGLAVLNAGLLALFTLAAPAADYDQLTILSADGQAYIVTAATNSINGANDTLTFGGAIGDSISLVGFGGKWIVNGTPSGVTLSEV